MRAIRISHEGIPQGKLGGGNTVTPLRIILTLKCLVVAVTAVGIMATVCMFNIVGLRA